MPTRFIIVDDATAEAIRRADEIRRAKWEAAFKGGRTPGATELFDCFRADLDVEELLTSGKTNEPESR
jgi:hypothetical protein